MDYSVLRSLLLLGGSVVKIKKVAKRTSHLDSEVTRFLDELNHPFRKEIEYLRDCILKANNGLTETIKWNGPNYCFEEEDRITMKIQPPTKQALLIFHRGTKKRELLKDKLIANKSEMLSWKESDRAIVTFKSLQEIESKKSELTTIINEWIHAAK